jgi:HK97 family phage prohead protease
MFKIESGQIFERHITLDATRVNITQRTVPATLSSELPVSRFYGQEILIHSPESVNLTRAADGLPLLFMHQHDSPIGIVRNVSLIDRTLKGVLYFSENAKANEVFRDVQGGFLKNVSIGYSVDKFEEQANSDNVRVTGWTLLEASVVSVPADPTVGINRSITGANPMTEENKSVESGTTDAAPVVDISKMKREHNIAKAAGAAEVLKAERARVSEIDAAFQLSAVSQLDPDFAASLRAQAIDGGWTRAKANQAILDAISDQSEAIVNYGVTVDTPVAKRAIPAASGGMQRSTNGVNIRMGEDALDKFTVGMTQGLMIRSGIITDRKEIDTARQDGFLNSTLREMAGKFLRDAARISTTNLDGEGCVDRALKLPRMTEKRSVFGQTTSDFTNILANVANKSLLAGWDDAPETWQVWTRRGELPDFKQAEISGLSGFTGLDVIPEQGDITYGKFSDRKELIKLVQYGKKYKISRMAILNDDLRAFTQIPRAMGRAANRKVGDITYALLDSVGPTLNQDSLALWHSSHSNYTLAATAPTVSTLNTATVAMARQTDPNHGLALNIVPRYLVVPVTLSNTARVLVNAVYDPAGSAGTLPPNPFNGRYEVVTDARLDGQTSGTAAWYLFADPNVFDTVEVAFLNGVAQPYMREEQEWDGSGTQYMVGIDFGVSVLDFRGMQKYRGS